MRWDSNPTLISSPPHMSSFALSQIFVAIAICFDLLSFQFKERRQIIACLIVACLLISAHFALLGLWTPTGLGLLASIRFIVSYYSSSKKLMLGFLLANIVLVVLTFQWPLSLLSGSGSMFGTIGSFCKEDKQLRQALFMATSLWLAHNILAGSPTAVLMETIFLSSNLLGYYRFYCRRAGKPV